MSHFEKYVNAIRKEAWYYSKKWNVEYDDVFAEGCLIYCECLDKHDITKSNFITHLTSELRRLDYYCLRESRYGAMTQVDATGARNEEDEAIQIESPSQPTAQDILEYSKDELTEDAFNVLSWILGRTWEKPGRRKPTLLNVCRHFEINEKRGKEILSEISSFYKKSLAFAF